MGFNPLIQYLTNNGYAILAVNNRGSSGYGKSFYKMDDKKIPGYSGLYDPPGRLADSISANLNIMIKAAEKASKSVIRDFGEVEKLQVSKKGPYDFVTKTDKHVEK